VYWLHYCCSTTLHFYDKFSPSLFSLVTFSTSERFLSNVYEPLNSKWIIEADISNWSMNLMWRKDSTYWNINEITEWDDKSCNLIIVNHQNKTSSRENQFKWNKREWNFIKTKNKLNQSRKMGAFKFFSYFSLITSLVINSTFSMLIAIQSRLFPAFQCHEFLFGDCFNFMVLLLCWRWNFWPVWFLEISLLSINAMQLGVWLEICEPYRRNYRSSHDRHEFWF
jgi:hypothetical protein